MAPRGRIGAGYIAARRRYGRRVCRMPGAHGGAPRGNRNAVKRGNYTAEAMAFKKDILALVRVARETMAEIE